VRRPHGEKILVGVEGRQDGRDAIALARQLAALDATPWAIAVAPRGYAQSEQEPGADTLLLLTDVAPIELDHGTPGARPLASATPRQLDALSPPGGSMGPRTEAPTRLVRDTGGMAAMGALEDATEMLAGRAGTTVVADRQRSPRTPPLGAAA
jgi:hypothetical protein